MRKATQCDSILRLATFNVEHMVDGVPNIHKGTLRKELRKPDQSIAAVANILADSGSDIVSLQEIENVEMFETLRDKSRLRELFPYSIFLEGNDRRKGIDVALMSRYPIRSFSTHRGHKVGELDGEQQHFSRDLLQVEINLPKEKLLRVFCNHFVAQGRPGDPQSLRWCDKKRAKEAQ